MSQINVKNSSLNSNQKNTSLTDLVKFAVIIFLLYIHNKYEKYEYNNTYLNPLALTNVSENKLLQKLFSLPISNLPKGEYPSLVWSAKVVVSLIVVMLNQFMVLLNKSFQNKPVSLEAIASNLKEIESQSEAIPSDFRDIGSQEKLKKVVENLELNLKKVDEQIQEYPQQNLAGVRENSIQILIEKEFQQIDDKIPQITNQNLQGATENLESSESYIIDKLQKIIKYAAKLAEIADNQMPGLESSPGSPDLDDYDKLFQVIDKPKISNKFQQDKIFAYLQVAGSNPVVLQQITKFDSRLPITEKQYSDIAQNFDVSDSLATALEDGRLYVADYVLLNSLVNGTYISESLQQQKYVSSPVALFAVPPVGSLSRSLFPVAISYQDTTVSYQWVLFTPLNTDSNGEPWMTAKNIVEMADCTYHEIISHLGRTHLFVEPFIVSTNNLPNNHCLRTLLKPHLEGTLLINYGAHTLLIAPGGGVDSMLGSSIGGNQSLAAKAAQSYLFNFNEVSFPQTLASRGVNDTIKLPIYPYRDDGLLIWDAIESWVSDYFNIYYSDDTAVNEDKDLQRWASTLISLEGGRLQNFGDDGQGHIKTRDYLVKAVSTIIFTASAQHAAVNFPQKEFMMYAPAFPLARYLPAPTDTQDPQSFIRGLPSLSQAQSQLNLLYLLGSVYYTSLGNYSTSAFPTDARLQDALKKFQNNLKNITDQINQQNRSNDRLIPYEFLLPDKIPQSINI